MKVNLISPPQPASLDDRLDPPLGLMYIGASLKSKGIEARITDLADTPKSQWKEKNWLCRCLWNNYFYAFILFYVKK